MGPAEERGSRSGAGYKALSNRYRVSAIERIGMCVSDGCRTWYSILSGCAGFDRPDHGSRIKLWNMDDVRRVAAMTISAADGGHRRNGRFDGWSRCSGIYRWRG